LPRPAAQQEAARGTRTGAVVNGLSMAGVEVGDDLLFFRDHLWERLVLNVGVVAVFGGGVCLRFLRP